MMKKAFTRKAIFRMKRVINTMLNVSTDEQVLKLIQSIGNSTAADDVEFKNYYSKNFAQLNQVSNFRSHYRECVANVVPSFSESIGCDLGCWFGFSTLFLK